MAWHTKMALQDEKARRASLLAGRSKKGKTKKPEDRLLWDMIPSDIEPENEAWIRDQLKTALKEKGLIGARQQLSRQLKALGRAPEGASGEPTVPLPAYASQKAAEKKRKEEEDKRKLDLRQVKLREKAISDLNEQQLKERALEEKRAKTALQEQRRVQAALDKQKKEEEKDKYRNLKDERAIIEAANKGLEDEVWGARMRRVLPNSRERMEFAKDFVRLARDYGLPYALDALNELEADARGENK
jgi:hypothetical protein